MSRKSAIWLGTVSFVVGLVVGIIGLRRGADGDVIGWVIGAVGFAGVLASPILGAKGQGPTDGG